jgi:hypothetical protein
MDFRDLNRATPKDEFPMPIAETLINAVTGNKILSFMDGTRRYTQDCIHSAWCRGIV